MTTANESDGRHCFTGAAAIGNAENVSIACEEIAIVVIGRVRLERDFHADCRESLSPNQLQPIELPRNGGKHS